MVFDYTRGVDYYSFERWLLDCHKATVRRAERRSHLTGGQPRVGLGAWLAECLRRLADRIDRGSSLDRHRSPEPTLISNGPF